MPDKSSTCESCGATVTIGDWPFCPHGSVIAKPHNALLSKDVSVYHRNPSTGETRVPGRADRPIHPKYVDAGFTERVPITTGRDMIQFERSTNRVHESSNYRESSGLANREAGAE